MNRAYYSASIDQFLQHSREEILGFLVNRAEFSVELSQRFAWEEQIRILKIALLPYAKAGKVYFEYAVPRLGKRIDVVAIVASTIFVIEFKAGEQKYSTSARDQVWDYALDLKNFHESSHDKALVPVLVLSDADAHQPKPEKSARDDGVFRPIICGEEILPRVLRELLKWSPPAPIRAEEWEAGRYKPTPTIVEAAMALYAGHGVAEISRRDASAKNLSETTEAIERIIATCREHARKAICFVTGVPGAGKTLVGLNVATTHADKGELH